MEITEQMLNLYDAALKASHRAYCPYSLFPVGAALLTTSGEVITACNVENRSYGLTSCAERNAIFSYIARGGKALLGDIETIAIAAPKGKGAVAPCGACRQVISEVAAPTLPVLFGTSRDGLILTTIGELYPYDSLHDLAK